MIENAYKITTFNQGGFFNLKMKVKILGQEKVARPPPYFFSLAL
jgi:hypothetical protein